MLLPQAIENVESHNDEAKRIIFLIDDELFSIYYKETWDIV